MNHIILFDDRNDLKKELSTSERVLYPKQRQIWNIYLGINIGTEQNGGKNFRRPFVITKKVGNLYFGFPLTSKSKDDFWHYSLPTDCMFDEKDRTDSSKVCLGQGRLIHPKRFIKHLGNIGEDDYKVIKKTITDLYL